MSLQLYDNSIFILLVLTIVLKREGAKDFLPATVRESLATVQPLPQHPSTLVDADMAIVKKSRRSWQMSQTKVKLISWRETRSSIGSLVTGTAQNTKLSKTHSFLELQSPDFAWKLTLTGSDFAWMFVWTI